MDHDMRQELAGAAADIRAHQLAIGVHEAAIARHLDAVRRRLCHGDGPTFVEWLATIGWSRATAYRFMRRHRADTTHVED